MRRSAAPSYKSSAKRLRFLPPIVDNISELREEDDLLNYMDPEIAKNFKTSVIDEPISYENKFNVPALAPEDHTETCLRSTNDILRLISDTRVDEVNNSESNVLSLIPLENNYSSEQSHNVNVIKSSLPQEFKAICNKNDKKVSEINCHSPTKTSTVSHYNVLWCKRSSKKHKKWEGDGVLIVRDRTAILKNSEGKEIDRGIGYKLKDVSILEEGSKFYIGSKECEIQDLISSKNCVDNEASRIKKILQPSESQPLIHKNPKPKQFLNQSRSSTFQSPIFADVKCNLDSMEEELILPSPPKEHQIMYNKKGLPLTDVKVDSFLVKHLRPHQKEGIVFMYKCILGFQHDYGQGVILADEMGLGKTFQCIALIWTLYKQGPYGQVPVIKQTIIITPSSLVKNWKKEFHKWLGGSRLSIFIVDKKNTIKDFMKMPKDILIISYEMFLRSAELLSPISFDLVICDEGHRIKNLNIKISNVVNCLSTSRRILLTGTPIQNDLIEFYSIVDFVNPGTLGSIKCFRNSFERPIIQYQNQDCSEEERELGEEKSKELNIIVGSFMLRRTQDVINRYLPPKSETVVFCRPSELQKKLYESIIGSRFIEKIFSSSGCIDSSLQFVYISMLRKLCNHPLLLYSENLLEESTSISCIQSVFPSNYKPTHKDSGKMKVLEKMMCTLFSSEKKEKVVIVSGFTKTLTVVEGLCKEKNYFYLRLDGSTPSSSRQEIVDVFNRSYTKYNVLLLSNKAGGVGLNLIGASRIILYDIDWNPANDLQAMARIWRDGQKHPVHVYRLITTGTIEEKIYQRQISKQCLSGTVLEHSSNEKLKFSQEELKDLFTFHSNTECLTHDQINCECLNIENVMLKQDTDVNKTQLKFQNIGMEELMNWKHICGPIFGKTISDSILTSCGYDITFLFLNKTNHSFHKNQCK